MDFTSHMLPIRELGETNLTWRPKWLTLKVVRRFGKTEGLRHKNCGQKVCVITWDVCLDLPGNLFFINYRLLLTILIVIQATAVILYFLSLGMSQLHLFVTPAGYFVTRNRLIAIEENSKN